MNVVRQLLRENRTIILDGATGTMLQLSGMPPGANPALFCLERPDIVRAIHKGYVEAGADIIVTPTFGGTAFKLPPGLDPSAFNRSMAEISKRTARELAEQAGRLVLVAGDIGPSGHFLKPLGDVSPDDMVDAFRAQARGLFLGGVDLILVETQFDLAEVRAIVAAVRLECSMPVWVSMTF
jgi:5-methyltetrahydrofolate--homocysteine methyltransferase